MTEVAEALIANRIEPTIVAPQFRDLDQSEKDRISATERVLENFAKNKNAIDWMRTTDQMVNILENLPKWDGATLQSVEKVFDSALGKIATKIPNRRNEFIQRWNSWVAEAAQSRLYSRLGVGQLIRSSELDKHGVDAISVLKDENDIYYIFLQNKSSRGVPPSIHIINPRDNRYSKKLGNEFGTRVAPYRFVNNEETYDRMRPGGDIYKFSREEAERITESLINNGKLDHNIRAHFTLLLVGVGTQAQDSDDNKGWMEVMKLVEIDKDYGNKLARTFRNGILRGAEKAEKL